ncbi:MAG: DNA-binding transcriptional regulator [Planctomycetota bacterium]
MDSRRKRVALLIESSREYGRGCLLGVADYLRTHGSWVVTHYERGQTEGVPRALREWRGDGVIARIENGEVADLVAGLGVPTVDLRGALRPAGGAMLDTDHAAAARLAADHLLDSTQGGFAYCGFPGVDFSDAREREFVRYLGTHGISVACYRAAAHAGGAADEGPLNPRRGEAPDLSEQEGERIGRWLQTLPGPVAVWACNDERGRQIVDACAVLGLAVPEQVAVVGVDNDAVLCELSNPPLSSIQPDTHRLGYLGAELLDRMIEGGEPPGQTVLVPPLQVHARRSTEPTAVDDRAVASAMRIIRDAACRGVGVEQVAKDVGISRSTLERRFRRTFGRSPAAEIERLRMARARLLLSETTERVAAIAKTTGYNSAAQFITAFKRHNQLTPGQYRTSQARSGAAPSGAAPTDQTRAVQNV